LPPLRGNGLKCGPGAHPAAEPVSTGGAVRIFLVILTFIALAGAADTFWRSPVFLVLPVLCAVCLALVSRISSLERRLRELEGRAATGRADAAGTRADVPASAASTADDGAGDFVFSEEAPARPVAARPAPAERPAPKAAPPGFEARVREWGRTAWGWFAGGNPVVKVGIVVLFFGVSFLLKYAADHSLVSVELRMTGAGLLGVALLALGWRLRRGKPVYALLVQGGGVGVLYLTIFAAARYVGMLPPVAALGLMTGVVVFSGVLAVAQNAMSLALFGAAGGFLAPVLLSTGQGSHVHLFAYYALLNLGVLGIAWRRTWRPLNLLGFACTFGIGAAWGARYYAPQYFATTEPFLILFFVMYGVVSILFARAPRENPRLDSALVFGLPLAAFALQMGLVRDTDMGGAFSCLGLALWYLLTLGGIRRLSAGGDGAGVGGTGLRLLGEAHLALGVIFVSLAVPMALDATWTASTWALEGAGMVWLGLRQKRLITRVFGVLLQLGAAISAGMAGLEAPLDDGRLLAGLFLGAGGLASSWAWWALPDSRLRQEKIMPVASGLWGAAWWYGSLYLRFADYDDPALVAALTASLGIWFLLQRRTAWPAARHLIQASGALMLPVALGWDGHPASTHGWLVWPLALAAIFAVLRALESQWTPREQGWAHSAAGLLVAVLTAHAAHWQTFELLQAGGWADAASAVTVALFLLAPVAAPLDWPLRRHRAAYLRAGAVPAAFLCLWWAVTSLFRGDPNPLPYIPVLNPMDMAQALVLAALAVWARAAGREKALGSFAPERWLPAFLGVGGFAWANVVLARSVHFLGAVPYSFDALFRSEVMQASCSVLWSTAAMAAMLLGWRRANRRAWLAGAALLAVVVVKLFLVDLDGIGTVARIVSFLGVGLLMLVMGYFCPLPPKEGK
jgi:uncharacterized membrane protein